MMVWKSIFQKTTIFQEYPWLWAYNHVVQGTALIFKDSVIVVVKDLTNQDDCYRKFYLSTHEGHGEGWSKLQFWQIWCDSRGHLALGSTILMIESPKSMQVQIHLGTTFVFHSPSWVLIQPTASMAEFNLGRFKTLFHSFLFDWNLPLKI